MKRKFSNASTKKNPGATISDRSDNPRLGNRYPNVPPPVNPNYDGSTGKVPGSASADWDYFRDPLVPQFNGAPQDSINPSRINLSVRLRWNPIRGLTPDRLTSYMEQWRFGQFRQLGMTFEAMERRDYQIKIDRPKRLKSVARLGYDILTLENIDPGMKPLAEEQKAFLQYFYDHLSTQVAINPDEEGGLSSLLRQMMDAVGKYYSVHEIIWQPQNDGNLTAKMLHVPVWWVEGSRGKLRWLDSEFQIYGRDMDPGEWLITCGDGIMEACSILYIFKHLPLKSWIAYLDKFGLPGIHVKTDAQLGSREWNQAVEAAQQFATDYAAITNRQVELNLIEAKASAGSGGGLFDTLVEKLDRAITQLWRGADLGTSARKDATGASLQQDETEILLNDDNKLLEETLALKLSKYALAWKFGPDTPALVYLKLRTNPRQITAVDIQTDQFLLSAGVPLGIDATLERYNRPRPRESEELLEKPQAPGNGTTDDTDNTDGKPKSKPANLANSLADVALHSFAAAVAEDLAPIADRLKAILEIQDPAIFETKLQAFLAWLDKHKADFLADPASAHELNKAISSAMVNGLAQRTKS